MKTKHLVAMALPLVFTACSQEELVTENSQTTTANRKTVENVVFKFNVDPESRMAFDGVKYEWEDGDKFGACLMDQYRVNAGEDVTTGWYNNFELVDYIQSNYPFTRQDDNSWTNAEAVMQEGNYFFYYPYNYNLGGKRTPIRMNVPTVQYLADDEATYKVLDEQMFVAYAPIVADPSKGDHETVTDLTMEPLLAFPAFNITNNTGNSFTISRIAIGGKDGDSNIEFPTVFEVKPATGKFSGYEFAKPNTNKRNMVLDVVSASTSDPYASTVSVVFGENGKTLENSKSFTSYIMLPAMDMLKGRDSEIDGLKLYIYTDKGLVTVPLDKDESNGDVNNDDIKVQNALTSYSYNDGHITYITLDERAFTTPASMEVASTRDLEDLVEWNKKTQSSVTAVLSQNVTVTKKIYDILAANSKLSLNLTASKDNAITVTIPEDAPTNAFEKVKFIAGDNNTTYDVATVNNYAKVTLTEDFTAASEFVNYGEMTWATGTISRAGDKNFKFINETNGILNIDFKGINIDSKEYNNSFVNYGTINVLKNAKNMRLTNKGITTVNEGVVCSDIYIDNTTEVRDGNQFVYGTLNVDGELSGTTSRINNTATVNVGVKGILKLMKDAACKNNEYSYPEDKPTYFSSIQNSGVISGIKNNGTIVMVTKEARLTSATGSAGYVNNTIRSPYVAKVDGETIFAEVSGDKKASEVATIVAESNAKELRLSGNITIDPKENESVVLIKGQGDLNVVVNGNLNIKPSKAGVELGFVNSDYTKENNKYATLTVKENVTAKVIAGSILSVGNVTNKGKIIVEANATVWANNEPEGIEEYGSWTTR